MPTIPDSDQPKNARFLSSWLAYPLALIMWEVVPWAISLLTSRHGWTVGRPGLWNLIGLILVPVGTAGLIWGCVAALCPIPRRDRNGAR